MSLLYQKGQAYRSKRSILHKLKININHERNKAKDQERLRGWGKGELFHRQAKSRTFICKKEKPVVRCKDIKNDVFDLVPQGRTELFANYLKAFYYICGIKFQNYGSNVQYFVKKLSKLKLYLTTDPEFEAVKPAPSMVQKGIFGTKIKKFNERKEILEENIKRTFTLFH